MQFNDIMELACLMLGKDYDSITDNYEESIIEDMFYEEYNITLEDFEHLLKDLVKFIYPWISPTTGKLCRGFVVKYDDVIKKGNNSRKKVIQQFTKDGKFIAEFNGILEACRQLNFKSHVGIVECCKGIRYTAYGYKWKYKL